MDRRRPRIISHSDHEGRRDLAGEHRLTDVGQLVGVLLFLGVWALDSFLLDFSMFLSSVVAWYVRLAVGAPLLILAAYMARTGLRIVFKEVREPPEVINKSVFSWVRHPIYLAEIILYIGLFIISPSLISLAVIALTAVFLDFAATQEERKLEEQFGRSYGDYKRRVGKWLPKFPAGPKRK